MRPSATAWSLQRQKPSTWATRPIERENCPGVQFRRALGDSPDQRFATQLRNQRLAAQ